jgi:uncharacterized protein YndB with AHSA1/START domain
MATGAARGPTESPGFTLERSYAAPPEQVWHAWTDPQALSRWFGPEDTESVIDAEVDLRVGGRYHIAFVTRDGERHDVSGVYREVEQTRKLVFSWAWRSTPERESLVSLLLEPDGDGTRLVFRHEQFFDETARDNHRRGWTGAFHRFERYLQAAA